jgi:hypothetical protein
VSFLPLISYRGVEAVQGLMQACHLLLVYHGFRWVAPEAGTAPALPLYRSAPRLFQAAIASFGPANVLDKVTEASKNHHPHVRAEATAVRFGRLQRVVAGDGLPDSEHAVLLGILHIHREPVLLHFSRNEFVHPLVVAQHQFAGRRMKRAFLGEDHQHFIRRAQQVEIIGIGSLVHKSSSLGE